MEYIDVEIQLNLKSEFTSIKEDLNRLIKDNSLLDANIVCWVPHEVGCLTQMGWEDGVVDDAKDFLNDIAPKDKYKKHDEPGTPFRYNFHQHIRTKVIGNVSMTLMVKDGDLVIGKYQDLYFYSPVYDNIPNQKIICRILKLK